MQPRRSGYKQPQLTQTYPVDGVVFVWGRVTGAARVVGTHEVDLVVHVDLNKVVVIAGFEPEKHIE